MNRRNTVLSFAACGLLVLASGACFSAEKASAPASSESGNSVSGVAHEVGRDTKKAGKAVGHGTRDAARAVGHGFRDGTRAIGHAFRDGGRAVKRSVKGSNERPASR